MDVAALGYARGLPPQLSGLLRVQPEDFVVEEDCAIVPSGSGEHLWLWIEKTGLTTIAAAERLSTLFGVHPRNVGYAGLKDRHAVTRQWFSLTWPIKAAVPDIADDPTLRLIEIHRHDRKLKRGAHRGNRFRIRIRSLQHIEPEVFQADVARLRMHGVPNYFGAQRFGIGGRNLALSRKLFSGRRLSRNQRGFALSAARSLLFNAVLDARVRADNWNRALNGDVFMLAGSNSVFAWDNAGQGSDVLAARVRDFDIHPAGPMPGRAADLVATGAAGAIEAQTLADYPDLVDGLAGIDIDAARRAFRLPVAELEAALVDDTLELSFWLQAGAFATSVLRELVNVTDASTG